MSSPYATLEEVKEIEEKRNELLYENRVKNMERRVVGQALSKCYKMEGPNQAETCKHLVERYTDMCKTHRITGVRKLYN